MDHDEGTSFWLALLLFSVVCGFLLVLSVPYLLGGR
jgi:hypothetical protein